MSTSARYRGTGCTKIIRAVHATETATSEAS